jgi:hypothetical protein
MAESIEPMSQDDVPRTPPTWVRRRLRQEVGFGCPVVGCANPYLEYHHFDPPWHIEQHHDPDRMIALCATHHAKADAWTVEQTRQIKRKGGERNGQDVQGRFEWMRDDVLAVVGGCYYYETPNMVVFREQPLIWFERDSENRLLLNLNMLSTSEEPRTSLVNNDWFLRGEPEDVDSPPNGSTLRVRYANGDDVSVRFRECSDAEALGQVHERALVLGDELRFPLVTAEVALAVGGTNLRFGPKETRLAGNTVVGFVASRCGAGLSFG